ncbi:MAG: DUF21 domain-containing protein, partial [Flavobacteriales bacterium]|nr:DUF21 domain-containing protein [Flavobacteriales bacterium]
MLTSIALILILLICSALISSAEIAYFSLSASDMKTLDDSKSKMQQIVLQLIITPKKLLATI